jgi:hypothetical protein
MAPRIMAAACALAASSLLFALPAWAECSTASTGSGCVRVIDPAPSRPEGLGGAMTSASAPTPLVDVGEVLPRGEYSIVLNAEYYGLPPVSDGWVYMRVGQDAYRVDWQTHEVLERVTERTAANF